MTIFNLTHQEFLNQYADTRLELIQNAAGDLARELQYVHDEMPIGKQKRVYQKHHIALALFRQIEDMKRWATNKVALEAYKVKELSDAPKWNLLNPVYFATKGGLKVFWDQKHTEKANKVFDGTFGQTKAVVFEHVYPTNVLKERLFTKAFRTLKQLVYYVSQRSVLSYTSAEEDKKLNKTGMTDPSNFFCRYDEVNLTTYPLKPEWSEFHRDLAPKKLAKSAAKAKKAGLTFEQWAESVINL